MLLWLLYTIACSGTILYWYESGLIWDGSVNWTGHEVLSGLMIIVCVIWFLIQTGILKAASDGFSDIDFD